MLVTAQDNIHDYTAEDVAQIVAAAQSAAEQASEQYLRDVLEGSDNFPCGFAWVELDDVRGNTRVGRAFKALGFTKIGKSLHWQNPGRLRVQNVDAKYAGAAAAVNVLRGYGFDACAADRLD